MTQRTPMRRTAVLMLCVLVVPLSLALAAPEGGRAGLEVRQTRRALRAEDYYRMKSVGAPRLSPDGRWVAFTVTQPVEATNTTLTETWVVMTMGAPAERRIQINAQDVSNPRWGEDNRLRVTLKGTTWSVDPANPTTPVEERTAAAGGAWMASPDGKWEVRVQDVPRTAPPAPALSDFERRHEERFKGDAFDWYPFRQDGQRFPLPNRHVRPITEVAIRPAAGGDPRQITSLGVTGIGGLQWLPDSSGLQFTLNEQGAKDEKAYGSTDLYRVTREGTLSRMTNDGHNYSAASFSPDGRWLVYERALSTQRIVDERMTHGGPQDLWIQPAGLGAPRNLTADWDRDPGAPQWSPDSRHLYFTAETGGAVHLFRVAAAGGPVEQITTGARRLNGVDFDRGFTRIAYTVGEFDRPSDIYVADIDGRNERRLTDVHRTFMTEVAVATRPSETVEWRSTDGTRIEGFLLFPHGYDAARGPYPLIVMNHGGPHAASGYGFNFKNSLFAAHGYFVFLPNFRSSTGYGDAFKWATWGGWGNKDGEDVISGIDALAARFPIDRQRVGTTGHSYGGILTNWLITKYPERFKAAIPGAGESNWTANYALSDISRTKDMEFFGPPWNSGALEVMIEQSPFFRCGNTKAATLFIHGDVDYRVPVEGAIQLYTCLKKIGVPTKMIIYEGQAHGISGHWNVMHRMLNELRWWEQYLKL